MKISYVTIYDALDIHNWSGLGYMIAKTLEGENNKIEYIGKLKREANIVSYLKSKLYNKVTGRDFDVNRDPRVAKGYAKQILPFISGDSDVVFSPGTTPISLLQTKTPKVFYTDATFAGMINFYEDFSNLSQETINHGNYLEQQALESSALAIYSSDWAAKTAIDNYYVHPSKVRVVPFGANISSDRNLATIKAITSNRSAKECHLLFLGVDWGRKGGDMAIKVADKLNQMGLKTTLHTAGVKNIRSANLPDFVVDHGFISKSTKEGRDKLDQLFCQSHFLILPTRADCTPVVFSEANSFGLPCITTDVGGIPTIIRNQINGKTFSLTDDENSYADYIFSTFLNKKLYDQLTFSSFNEYDSRLNWNATGKIITKFLKEL